MRLDRNIRARKVRVAKATQACGIYRAGRVRRSCKTHSRRDQHARKGWHSRLGQYRTIRIFRHPSARYVQPSRAIRLRRRGYRARAAVREGGCRTGQARRSVSSTCEDARLTHKLPCEITSRMSLHTKMAVVRKSYFLPSSLSGDKRNG